MSDNDGYSVIGGGESSDIGCIRNGDEIKAVEIRAELRQVKSMVDGTFNIVLNIPEDCREQVKKMIDWLGMEVRAVIVEFDK